MGTSLPLTCEEPAVNSNRIAKPWKKTNNGKRLRDANGYRLRAAGLCQRRTDGELEVLLVSGRTNPNHWIIPGGGIEEAEEAERAVVRELKEEAGVTTEIIARIGEFINHQRKYRTVLYTLRPVETLELAQWEDGQHGRQRRWMSFAEAMANVKECQRVMLEQAVPLAPSV